MVNEMMGEGLIFKALNVRSPQFLHLVSKAHLWKSFGFLVQAIKPEVAYSTRNAERNKKMLNAKKVGEKFPIAIADGNGRSMLLNIVV